jgi:hypothetical protein
MEMASCGSAPGAVTEDKVSVGSSTAADDLFFMSAL